MSDAKIIHRVIRRVAGWAIVSFFSEIHVIGGENVPRDGPIIVTATHHNMVIDPAVLSYAFPYRRILHYWAKQSLFVGSVMTYILTSAGNIPVDRKTKDRRKLFAGTMEALAQGTAVALFPEGTSYTEPRIMQVKDGAAWAALEYTKWRTEQGNDARPVTIVPTAIVYTDKSKYRSRVIMEFGKPITMEPFIEQFLAPEEGAARAAVKRLTATIERELVEATVNAPDWDILYCARMARELLWENQRSVSLDDFVPITQTLVDLFSTPDLVPRFNATKKALLTYYSLLQSSNLTNTALSTLPLPLDLDPNRPVALPSRLRTLSILVAETLAAVVRLPLFVVPLLVHAPAYAFARVGAKLVEDEEETQAQNKVAFGLLLLMIVYTSIGIFVWSILSYTVVGALLATGFVFLFAWYHNSLIDEYYDHAKRLVAAWRVLVGVWAPKHWDLSLPALTQYTIPRVPAESAWIDKPRSRPPTPVLTHTEPNSSGFSAASISTNSTAATSTTPAEGTKAKKTRRPPSRRIVRHVLRARIEAAKALAALFAQLERSPDKRVRASTHLARMHGGTVDPTPQSSTTNLAAEGVESVVEGEPRGWRDAHEVVQFLRERGAKIAQLRDRVAGEWAAALSSENEGETTDIDSGVEDLVWVPSGSGSRFDLKTT
ncbi:glycerol-3-phosphate-acyltransferase [Phanerochaete sordida]|uniref:Glycerol-3-phosphate-acyltransferase n=1 Tax=Phanerochaete sordida TaxID=48140 RepID=A0A9P3G877_9APHY|nr:glycerol-3-phosphate-acyltransferase [Phanerochaete sordida]